MKFTWFNLMPWPYLPDDFREQHRSVRVDIPHTLYDPRRGHHVYHTYLDQLEYAETLGFDGIGCNEHHQNGYGLMPSPNLIAASLARRTSRAALCVIGNSIAGYNPPIRVAEEFAMLELAELLFHDPERGQALLTGGADLSDLEALKEFYLGSQRRLAMAGKILFPIPNRRLAKRLYRLAAETLLVWGTADRLIVPAYAARWQALIPGARLAMLEGAAHMLPYEQPEAFARTLTGFLA